MIHVLRQTELNSTVSDPRQDALHAELESTRAAFHAILDTVTKTGWRSPSPSSAWTKGEVLVHLTWALEYLPEEIRRARQGRGMFNTPKRIADFASYWYIRWLARTSTPETIARRYDRAMDAVIALLDSIPDEDWAKGADFYAEGFHSVEDLFHTAAKHLTDHTILV